MRTLLLVMLLACTATTVVAQTLPDTIGMHKSRFRFTYQGEKIKRPKPLGELLLREPDPQLRATWQNYKGAHGGFYGHVLSELAYRQGNGYPACVCPNADGNAQEVPKPLLLGCFCPPVIFSKKKSVAGVVTFGPAGYLQMKQCNHSL